jgi:hypothetical protein
LAELYREYFTGLSDTKGQLPRGRPAMNANTGRNRNRVVAEQVNEIFDPYKGREKGETPLPPGHVEYTDQFVHLWTHLVEKGELEEITVIILRFLQKKVRESIESDIVTLSNIAPNNKIENCCVSCGVNHEARDFMRALSLRLIDEMEKSEPYLSFLKENGFITDESFKHASHEVSMAKQPQPNAKVQ